MCILLGIRDPKSRGTRQVSVGEQSDSHVETMMACCMLWKEEVTYLHDEVPLSTSSSGQGNAALTR